MLTQKKHTVYSDYGDTNQNFCSWNCLGDSKGRSSEFGIPNIKSYFLSILSNLALGI